MEPFELLIIISKGGKVPGKLFPLPFGGFDKKLSLVTIDREGELKCDAQELKIAMQCQGMQINGVVREEERLLLENLIDKASS